MRLTFITTAVAACLAGIGMISYDLTVYRRSWTTDLANQAAILGVSVAAALEFDDRGGLIPNLQAMRVRPEVLSASVYTPDGRLYASYARDAVSAAPAKPPAYGEIVSGERVELSQPVLRNGKILGSIYLRAHYDVWGRLGAYLGIFFADFGLSLAVAFVLARRLQKSITEPLDAMTEVAQAVVSRRDYSLRARRRSDDEIGLAVLAFNGMLDEVEARASVSDAAMLALRTEVRVRQQAEEALLEADRRKDEFLATLAHELRNPLAPIRHAVKLLENNLIDEPQRQWGRAVIGRQVQRMALLLDDLLDVSRITRGQLTLKTTTVDLRAVVDAALEVARPLIETKRHQLIVNMAEQQIILDCDPLRLSQALSNLLSNAAKYTDEGGRITLIINLSGSELKIAVGDTGIGIQPRAIPGLFHIFSQVDSAIDRAEGGLGIGLALVKGLIALHGGRVEVSSPGVGLGSEFCIFLPISRVSINNKREAPPQPRDAASPTTSCKVLMADDNRDAVDSMSLLLELSGYQTIVAYNGYDAVAMVQEHRPQVVLLDIGMPDLTGYEAARAIRQSDYGRSVYLIAMTGWGQVEDKAHSAQAGFDEHLTKPVDPDRIVELLRNWLRDHQCAAGVD